MVAIKDITFERRLSWVFGTFLLAFIAMTLRLIQIQVVEAADYHERIEESLTATYVIPARRGDIVDRLGRTLAATVATYDLFTYPAAFRERNKVDALEDLVWAWLPDMVPVGADAPVVGQAHRVDARLRRFRAVYEGREPALRRLFALSPAELVFDKATLVRRLGRLCAPRHELVLPPSRLERRVLDALLVLADSEAVRTRRDLRKRLRTSASLSEALAVDAAECRRGIEDEVSELRWLAGEVTGGDLDALLRRLFLREAQDLRRLARRIDDVIDDRIALAETGHHDLESLGQDELERLARRLRIPDPDPARLREALDELVARSESDRPEDERRRLARIRDIVRGRPLADLEEFERRSLARLLELWIVNPESLKRGLGERRRDASGFARRDVLTAEKEWARRLQYKGGVPYRLFPGCRFAVASRVWTAFGLRRLGFDVSASYGREYWEDEAGVATVVIGRVNRGGAAMGGLELALSRPGPDGEPGPLVGTPGRVRKRREPDRSLVELADRTPAQHGATVRLALDRELQRQAEDVLVELSASLPPNTGCSACVLDVPTGDVLVLASVPRVTGPEYLERYLEEDRRVRARRALENARREGDLSAEEYAAEYARLKPAPGEPTLYDRASVGGFHRYYPPGSVLKPFVATGLLEEGTITGAEIFTCRKYGRVDLHGALVHSSNDYFQHFGGLLGRDGVLSWLGRFGMFHEIPLLASRTTCSARRRVAYGPDSRVKNAVIGQGSVTSSPLEVAAMMATLARRGRYVVPRIVVAVDGRETAIHREPPIDAAPSILERIIDAMCEVAARHGGSEARRLGVAGKTGTAELKVGREDDVKNAWFAGFAPHDRPRLAFAVCCERTDVYGKRVVPAALRILSLAEPAR